MSNERGGVEKGGGGGGGGGRWMQEWMDRWMEATDVAFLGGPS